MSLTVDQRAGESQHNEEEEVHGAGVSERLLVALSPAACADAAT